MLQVVLTGLSTGAIYGLVAMGFAVVFYVTGSSTSPPANC